MSATVTFAEDRMMRVEPHQRPVCEWIDIDRCVLACRERMAPEAVEKKWRRLLQQGEAACWPPLVGRWRADGRFEVLDGRHEYVASLMHGRRKVLAAWIADA